MKPTFTFTVLLSALLLLVVPAPAQADIDRPVIEPCESIKLCESIPVCRTVEDCCYQLGFWCDITVCQTVEDCCYQLGVWCDVPTCDTVDECCAQLNLSCDVTICRPITRCCEIISPNPCECILTGDCLNLPTVYVRDNGDGTYTVGYNDCGGYADCDHDLATVASDPCAVVNCGIVPDDLCFTYNPDALTNLCVTTSSGTQPVNHPSAELTSRRTCVVGEEGCVTHAWVAPSSTTTYVPVYSADGYVEVTAGCGFGVPCRVTLP